MKKLFRFTVLTILMSLLASIGVMAYGDTDTPAIYTDKNALLNDFRDETIYFVITTRFYDGDSSNNTYCWDGTAINGEDMPWRGDFKGLIDKLDYIKALGFTAIWITPVVKNASGYDYHGYHALNFKEVDKRYESDDCTYQDLIDAVHEHGMKIIQDVVFNHTGNFGEENLLPLFSRDDSADLSDITECMIPNPTYFPDNYFDLEPGSQYAMRLDYMKNHLQLDGIEKDTDNLWHHFGDFNWDDYTCQMAQIAGDCVDLNTENPKVYKYLVEAYGKYIEMGVDAFRVDTVRHMSRLSLNKGFITQLNDIYNKVHGTSGEGNFYMFGEVCTRYTSIWYREVPALSTPFYTWKESKEYEWNDNENDPDAYVTNIASTKQHYDDNDSNDISSQPTSDNALLNGNTYHEPDHSMASGLSVIDFPMHWNFKAAKNAFKLAISTDKYYNDATYNVVYVDSHDYAPDGAPESQRFSQSQSVWAENLDLMFTFRGIPCLYYGSEVEFKKGNIIDKGTLISLEESGRAYFGDLISGSIDTVDFGAYANVTGKMKDALNHPLSLHIQRLNRLRAAIPALRKGQYSVSDITYSEMAFKRRYTDDVTDSFALVTISGNATFNNIPNGKYTDAITGEVQFISNNSLSAQVSKKGDMRVYVLDTSLTKAPGMIAGNSIYLDGGKSVLIKENPVTSIELDAKEVTVELGETAKLKATVLPANATGKNITWLSSDSDIASVKEGKITPKKSGTVTIIAKTENGLSAKAIVKVTVSGIIPEKINLSTEAIKMNIGDKENIKAEIIPADSTNKTITWKSSDTNIAKVSEGEVTAKGLGTAVITASTVNGIESSVVVTVTSKVVTGDVMYFEKPEGWGNSIKCYMWCEGYTNTAWPGASMEEYSDGVYVISYPENVKDLNVIFNDGGNQTKDLKAVVNGYFNKDGFVRNEATEKVEVSEIKTSDTELNLKAGDSKKITTTVYPENATNKKIVYSTSDKDIVSVDADGNISANGSGEAIIYCTALNGVTSQIITKVAIEGSTPEANISKIFINKFTNTAPNNKLLLGEKAEFSVEATDTDNKALTYKFSYVFGDENVVISDFSSENHVSFQPQKLGNYDIICEVKNTDGDIEKADIKGFYVHNGDEEVVEPLKVLSFIASKKSGSVKVGNTIKLSVAAVGGEGAYSYKFSYKLAGKTTKIKDYQSLDNVTWNIKKSGKYTLYVYVKDAKGNTAKKTISSFNANKAKIDITSFKAGTKSGQAKTGKNIKLNVKAKGGYKTLKYKYTYKLNGKTTVIKSNSSKTSVNVKFKKKGTYTLYVYVKDSDGNEVKKAIKSYKVK